MCAFAPPRATPGLGGAERPRPAASMLSDTPSQEPYLANQVVRPREMSTALCTAVGLLVRRKQDVKFPTHPGLSFSLYRVRANSKRAAGQPMGSTAWVGYVGCTIMWLFAALGAERACIRCELPGCGRTGCGRPRGKPELGGWGGTEGRARIKGNAPCALWASTFFSIAAQNALSHACHPDTLHQMYGIRPNLSGATHW